MSIGNLGFFPNSSKYGLYPIMLFLVVLEAYINLLSESFRLYFNLPDNIRNLCMAAECKRSTVPLHIG